MADKGYTRSQLVDEISRDTHLRREVVDEVLTRFVDVALEQMVNERDFNLMGLFSVTSYEVKGAKVPGKEGTSDQRRITLRLSKNVKLLARLQRDHFSDKPFFINRDTWRGALKWYQEGGHKATAPRQAPQQLPTTADSYNPLLDEEDE